MFGLFSWGEANCELHKRILIFLSTDSSRTSSLVGKPSQTVPPDGNGASLSKNEIGTEDYRKTTTVNGLILYKFTTSQVSYFLGQFLILTFVVLTTGHFLSQQSLGTLWFGFNLCEIKRLKC